MKFRSTRRLASGLSLAAFASTGFAFQPLITDDTGTQGKGGNQLEFSVNEDHLRAGREDARTLTLPLVYTYGFADNADVYVTASHIRNNSSLPGADASGGGNPALGIKWRFYENEESKTSLAFKPELRFPVSAGNEADGLGQGRPSFGASLILTQETSFGAVHANFAVNRNRYRESAGSPDATALRASLAPVWDLSEHCKLVFDLGVEAERAGSLRTWSRFAEVGAIYSPNKDLDFAVGVIRRGDNANPSASVTSLTAGVTWRFR